MWLFSLQIAILSGHLCRNAGKRRAKLVHHYSIGESTSTAKAAVLHYAMAVLLCTIAIACAFAAALLIGNTDAVLAWFDARISLATVSAWIVAHVGFEHKIAWLS